GEGPAERSQRRDRGAGPALLRRDAELGAPLRPGARRRAEPRRDGLGQRRAPAPRRGRVHGAGGRPGPRLPRRPGLAGGAEAGGRAGERAITQWRATSGARTADGAGPWLSETTGLSRALAP